MKKTKRRRWKTRQVGKQNAAECMPLIMEPTSAFYSSPLVVLDFQSLYPSVMIAYNYCYSTCLGRVTDFNGENKLGVVNLSQPHGILNTLKDHIQSKLGGFKCWPLELILYLSRTQWCDVCEAWRSPWFAKENVDRIAWNEGYGKAGDENHEGQQGDWDNTTGSWTIHTTSIPVTDESAQCKAIGPKIYLQRNIWVYKCYVFWQNACSRNCW